MDIKEIAADWDHDEISKVVTRFSTHRYQLLSEETKDRIKELAGNYCCDRRYDPDFECFEVTWHECHWLFVNLIAPEIFSQWSAERLKDGKTQS